MEQAGSYGGGGNFVPRGHSSAPAVDSLAYDTGGLNLYRDLPPREPLSLPHETSYASAPSESFYNSNFTYASPQPSVQSYSPRVPSYEDYTSSTANVASYSVSGGYNDGIQSYGSARLPTSGAYQQVGYEQVKHNQFAHERPGYGPRENGTTSYEGRGYEGNGYDSRRDNGRVTSSDFATSYDDGGYAEVHVYDGGSRRDAASFVGLKATPKVDESDTSGGILKYRVKMLSDMSSSTSKDVIFHIGLDGVRMVDPGTGRTLRVYPLDTITRWEVKEPSVFTFWAKSAVDIEERSICLQSSAYTTSSILDTITAACVQWCEMGGKDGPGKATARDNAKSYVPAVQRKTSVVDWVSTIRPRVPSEEEKYHWVPDEDVGKCKSCHIVFSTFNRKHHCRSCGDIYCDNCTKGRTALTAEEGTQVVRVCDRCLAEVTQRLTNAKDTTKVTVPVSHEDLAKKLQEELERNARRKELEEKEMRMNNTAKSITQVSGKPTSKGSGSRMQEVACPTCTVHLQVQVPSLGTETVECEVCQHLFLVAA